MLSKTFTFDNKRFEIKLEDTNCCLMFTCCGCKLVYTSRIVLLILPVFERISTIKVQINNFSLKLQKKKTSEL